MKPIFFSVLIALLSGCASAKYAKVPKGEVGGRLTIEWVGADKFIYRPDPKKPFYFKRANGEVIQPRSMYTDGGSIPRPLWSLRGYSPWGFGPAFIAHDWLFDAHHCSRPEAKDHTVFTAADVLAEVMKTLMEADQAQVLKSPYLLYTIDEAVRTPIAQKLWNEGKCQEPPLELMSPSRFSAPFSARAMGTRGFVQSYDLDALKR
jgi:hypothetical protein